MRIASAAFLSVAFLFSPWSIMAEDGLFFDVEARLDFLDDTDPSVGKINLIFQICDVAPSAPDMDTRAFFLLTHTPDAPPAGVDPQLATQQSIFEVLYGGNEPVEYLGAQVKREPYTFPEAHGEIVGCSEDIFNIYPLYNFSRPGTYTIRYNGENSELVCDFTGDMCKSTIPSDTISIDVSGNGLVTPSSSNVRRQLADSFPGCDVPGQKEDIQKAKAAAQKCAKDSCDCLNTLKGNEDNSYFEMFFGDDTPEHIMNVKKKFKAIKDDLNGDIAYECSTKEECDAVKKDLKIPIERNIFGYYKGAKKRTVHLCQGFWDAAAKEGKDTKMGVIIHEVSHFIDGAKTGDPGVGLEGSKKLAKTNPADAQCNADSYEYFCECLPNGGGGAWGDPHFKTWHGSHYDFHGECDLVLLDAPSFDNGRGMRIHVRTQMSSNRRYSYLAGLALQIGDDVLEVGAHGEYWFNGQDGTAEDTSNGIKPTSIGGHKLNIDTTAKKRHTFKVKLNNSDQQWLTIGEYRAYVSVSFNKNGDESSFEDSVGLMGSYTTGTKLARDGVTVIHDSNDFGLEWQVRGDDIDPILFHTAQGPQYPTLCILPNPEEQVVARRLSEATVTKEQAEEACQDWPEDEKDTCVFDVLAMDDLDMALFSE